MSIERSYQFFAEKKNTIDMREEHKSFPINGLYLFLALKLDNATWQWEGAIDDIDDIAVFNTVLTENDINDIINGINLSVESLGKLTTMWGYIKQYPE